MSRVTLAWDAPHAGRSTFCDGIDQYLYSRGKREEAYLWRVSERPETVV